MGKTVSIDGQEYVDAEVVSSEVAGPNPEAKAEESAEVISSVALKFENVTIKDAFESFVRNYKGQVEQYLNMFLANEGVPVDAFIGTKEDGTITVYQQAPDKGLVISGYQGELALTQYVEIPNGERYGVVENGAIFLYLKEPKGMPDIKLGQFKTLSDAAKDWNSESVNKRVSEVKEYLAKGKSTRANGVKAIE